MQDTWNVNDTLTVNFGFKSVHVENEGEPVVATGSFIGRASSIEADEAFLPQVGFTWAPGDEHEIFGGYAENVRAFVSAATAGPFSTTQSGFDAIENSLEPETSRTLEFGWRYTTDDFQGVITAYHVTFDDRLLSVSLGAGIVGAPSALSNVGEVETNGVEVGMLWQPIEHVSLLASYSYTDSEYSDDVVSGTGAVTQTRGKTVLDTPENMFKAELGYDDGALFAKVGFDYIDERFFNYLNDHSGRPHAHRPERRLPAARTRLRRGSDDPVQRREHHGRGLHLHRRLRRLRQLGRPPDVVERRARAVLLQRRRALLTRSRQERSIMTPGNVRRRDLLGGALLGGAATLLPTTAPALATARVATGRGPARIGFGSCAKQTKPQPIWDAIVELEPELFIMLGDNVYGDTRDPAVLQQQYDLLAAQPGFRRLRERTPILATWDDHDYGEDDAGADYPMKEASRRIFCDFWGEPAASRRRTRDGIYTAHVFGPAGRRMQVLLPDLRFNRTRITLRDLAGTANGSGSGSRRTCVNRRRRASSRPACRWWPTSRAGKAGPSTRGITSGSCRRSATRVRTACSASVATRTTRNCRGSTSTCLIRCGT